MASSVPILLWPLLHSNVTRPGLHLQMFACLAQRHVAHAPSAYAQLHAWLQAKPAPRECTFVLTADASASSVQCIGSDTQSGPCMSWLSSAQTGLTKASHSLCCTGVSKPHDIIPCCRWESSRALRCLGVAVVGLVKRGHALWLLGLLAHAAGGQHGRGGNERHASQRADRGSGDGA